MQSREELIEEIKSVGLFCDSRGNIYGKEYEPFLRRDAGFWQYPEELADLVIALRGFRILNFLNIGTFNGLTFNFISDKLNEIQSVKCVSVDPFDHTPNKKKGYEYVRGTSQDFEQKEFDLVFIDGDHHYRSVMSDWDLVGKYANIVVFHDIIDDFTSVLEGGVPRAWNEIKNSKCDMKTMEIVRGNDPGYPRIMGIGVIWRYEFEIDG